MLTICGTVPSEKTKLIMQIPFMRLDRQYADNKEAFLRAVTSVFEHGKVLQGPEVGMLEKRLAALFGMKHAAGVASGTDALVLAMKALNIKAGARVAVTSLSFVASASAIVQAGAFPIFVDIDPVHFCMREDVLLELVRKNKVDGVVAVHLYGQMMELKEVYSEAQARNIFIIEDAAQALGASRNGIGPGVYSDAMCLSFDPTKVVGAHGSGGAVLSNRSDVDARIRLLRYHGHAGNRVYSDIGHNSQLPTVQAALLLEKLNHEAHWRCRREEIAGRYDRTIDAIAGISEPRVRLGNKHNYHKYVMSVANDRDGLAEYLQKRGISTSIHYSMPLHKQPCFVGRHETAGTMLHVEAIVGRILSLPIYPELTDDEISYICSVLHSFPNR